LEKYNEGVAVLSGCADGILSCTLLGGKSFGDYRDTYSDAQMADADRRVRRFHEVFGDRFYLEVQRIPKLDRTCTLNPAFEELSAKHGIPLIATADVHYPEGHFNKLQATLHASRWRSAPENIVEASWENFANLTYPLSDDELIQDLVGTGLKQDSATAALQATKELSNRCHVVLPKAKQLRFSCGVAPNGSTRTARQELILQIRRGLDARCKLRPDIGRRIKDYRARIESEFKVIADKDFSDYFLVTADLVKWAKDKDIDVGPGRGSAAGSLICYVLGITEIDPLHPTFSRMVFERFIDPTRSDMPDIDLDFDDVERHRVGKRAVEVYGPENVCNVANHTRYRGKSSLGGVASAYNLPRSFFDEIGKRCTIRVETDERVDDTILDVLENYSAHPRIAPLVAHHSDKLAQAVALEGNQFGMGIHAGGYIISSTPIPEVCAIYTKEKGQGRRREMAQVIPYEKRDAEYLNMLKMDFLGLATMGQQHLMRKWTKTKLSTVYNLYYEDYATGGKENDKILANFRNDDCMGIFQYEGGTTRQVVRQVQPDNFDELAACGALSRPGPFYGGQTSEYIKVKNGEKDWERIHPTGFDRHVEWTYGQIVYQEQIMWILRDLANFSIERVLKVRKIIGKKLGEFQFAALWEEFKSGCANNGVVEEVARRVWSAITTAAGYAFNTAHAYSYALVAWWQMYFKIHHVKEFFAGSLAKNGDGKEDLSRRTALLKDTLEHGIAIKPINPATSDVSWVPLLGNAIVPGFTQMPDVGEATAQDICQWRETFMSERAASDPWGKVTLEWADLLRVNRIGDATVQKFYEFAALKDPFGINRTSDQLGKFREQNNTGEFTAHGLPSVESYCASDDMPDTDCRVAYVGLVSNISEKDEVEGIRQRTGKSVAEILGSMDEPEKTKKATLYAYDESGEVALRISRWRYDALSDKISAIECDHHIVVGYGRYFADRPNALQLEQLWVLEPD